MAERGDGKVYIREYWKRFILLIGKDETRACGFLAFCGWLFCLIYASVMLPGATHPSWQGGTGLIAIVVVILCVAVAGVIEVTTHAPNIPKYIVQYAKYLEREDKVEKIRATSHRESHRDCVRIP